MTPGVLALLAGLSITGSHGLGYEDPYPGLQIRADYEQGHFVARAEGGYLWAEKSDTGDGNGQHLKLLAGFRGHPFDLLGGVSYSRQETSAYEKDKVRRVAEAGWTHSHFRAAITYAGNNAPEESNAFGIRLERGNRLRIVGTFERIRFTDYFGNKSQGHKLSVALLWRVHKTGS